MSTSSLRASVVGVGNTRYGVMPDMDAYDLGLWALKDALADAGLDFADIDGLILNRIPDYQRFAELCGINPQYTLTTPGHGRSAAFASKPRPRCCRPAWPKPWPWSTATMANRQARAMAATATTTAAAAQGFGFPMA